MFSFQIVDQIRRQSSWSSCEFSTRCRLRRDATRQLSRVGVGGVYCDTHSHTAESRPARIIHWVMWLLCTWVVSWVECQCRSLLSLDQLQSSWCCTVCADCNSRSSLTRARTRSDPWRCVLARRHLQSSTQRHLVECFSWTATFARKSRLWNSAHIINITEKTQAGLRGLCIREIDVKSQILVHKILQ